MPHCWRRQATLIVALACLAPAGEATARDWYRYENQSFIAYSNGPERRTRLLLEELERFRTVFLLIGNVDIPADAPRTRVILTRNRQEFLRFTTRFIGGFAMGGDGPTLIVMPVTGERDWAMGVIRHEFAHALLRYKDFQYPFWYEEGFAEMMSAVTFPDRGRAFTIGGVPDRAAFGSPRYDWNELVAEDFNLHAIRNPEVASSAYAQAWLLAHWATFGDETRNARRLQRYFELTKSGMRSLEAFSESFGATPAELWAGPLREYSRRVPVYTFSFDTTMLDIGFERTPADPAEYEPILEFLEVRHAARGSRVIREPLAHLQGQWGVIPPDWHQAITHDHCASPVTFSVDTDAGLLTSRWRDAHGRERGDTARIEILDRETLLLHPGSDRQPEIRSLQMPNPDLMCMREPEDGHCLAVLQRC